MQQRSAAKIFKLGYLLFFTLIAMLKTRPTPLANGICMPDSEQKNTLHVHQAESGQKLLQFLMRRLNLPQALLHRWIRTGQVRINGGRIKPFAHVQAGDMVRIPPFALGMNQSASFEKNIEQCHSPDQHSSLKTSPQHLAKTEATHLALPPLVYGDEHISIYNKPSGLPVHGGTGHEDSLAARLEAHFAHAPFKPTPAHRLDKDTSGLICVAQSYAALRLLQQAFATHSMHKEYLAVVHGSWPHEHTQKLRHNLAKKTHTKQEKVHALQDDEGKEAISLVRCIARSTKHSLMHIRLVTGRTHQIRVQMAQQGHPIVGDGKYGKWQGPFSKLKALKGTKLYLHSLRLTMPKSFESQDPILRDLLSQQVNLHGLADKTFTILPPWEKDFAVDRLPPPLEGI